jgi:hypothetical protein
MTPRHHRPVTRRRLLTALCGAVVAGPAISVIAPDALATPTSRPADTGPQESGALPLTIANATGAYGNASVHVYVVGTRDGHPVRVTPDDALARAQRKRGPRPAPGVAPRKRPTPGTPAARKNGLASSGRAASRRKAASRPA